MLLNDRTGQTRTTDSKRISFLGERLLLNDGSGQTRTTDPKRIALARQLLARALKLAPDNEAYRKLQA